MERVFADPNAGRAGSQVDAIIAGSGDTKGFGEASGPAGKSGEVAGADEHDLSSAGHFIQALEGFECPEQNRSSFPFVFAGNVQTIVIAVNEIYVSMARGPEKDGCTSGVACGSVSGGITLAEVGFDFDDPGCEEEGAFVPDENFPQKCASYLAGAAGKESAVENFDRMWR
jgi:hypothetical protein